MKAVFACALIMLSALAHAQYPQRPVQLVVPWASGGVTDAMARLVASLLEKEIKQPVNVLNRTGGSGVAGHQAIAAAPADGYTLGMITVEITMMHHVGMTQVRHTDYTPIALMNVDPAAINVRADAPYRSVNDLLAAIKANPGKLRASGAGQGGIWHLAMAGLLKGRGIDPTALAWVPSDGAPPALRELLAGGVEVVPCSIPEARAMIHEGKVRTLQSDGEISAWRAIAGPKGLPLEAQRVLVPALKKVHESREFREFMVQRGLAAVWADPDGTARFMALSDAHLGAALGALGLAK